MLKLYTNTDFLVEAHRREVFPLLFDLVFKKNSNLLNQYKIVNEISLADIVVFPIDYTSFLKHKEAFSALNVLVKTYQKPIWIYTSGDYGFTNYIPNSYTFRLGGFNSKLGEHTFIIPSFINDPYKFFLSEPFSVLKKEDKPSIGFVGHAQSGISKYFKEYSNHVKYKLKRALKKTLVDAQPFYPSSVKRAKYLQQLAPNTHLNTHFILRNNYRAGLHSAITQKTSSQEFYNNIFENGYTFCLRGVGNFSVRFYETLAVGRIPIVINTDCRFPLENEIEWHKHCLIINETSKKPIAEHVLEFHKNLSDAEYEAIQNANRNLWLNLLQREAYFIKMYQLFKAKLN
ncbi:exostosin family protein [Jejuia pallidilutea]|uniref:Exostosin family protein n=1 Tax=Jejuia pallidilutea TaxID=504487 RepID=A0A362WYE1_9FLAO|nr:hypothetical protein [Jejuia pallidilutea]PQV47294.1 exostosin family protein [Jejuia pallidilutea]